MKKHQAGFTIMELLVVLTCIIILVSVTIATLSTSRNRGADSSIKSQLNALRTQAALYFNTNGTYGTFSSGACPAIANTSTGTLFHDSEVRKHTQSAGTRAGGIVGTGGSATTTLTACAANGPYWAAAVVLKGDNTTAWCVDHTNAGKVSTITADTPTTAYNGASYTCN